MFEDLSTIEDYKVSKYFPLIMNARRVQLSIGCLVILIMIFDIFRRRLYVYNTLRLYLFMCICYLIGMFVILLHFPAITNGFQKTTYKLEDQRQPNFIIKILRDMKDSNNLVWCGLQAFVNLYFYCLGYFFAVLITYNVYCVINNTYRNFMKNVLKMKRVIFLLVFMFLLYALPFGLMFVYTFDYEQKSSTNYNYNYSYGPTGFTVFGQNLLLFCGQCFNPINYKEWNILSIMSQMYLIPIILLIIHTIFAIKVKKETKMLLQDQYLNSKQHFIIRSGDIGYIILGIQGINLVKQILSSFIMLTVTGNSNKVISIVVLILNFLFDLYPFVLLWFFRKYTKEKKGVLAGGSSLIEEN